MSAESDEVAQHVRAARERLLSLTEQTPALIQCCPPLTDAIARLTHALLLIEGEVPWPPAVSDLTLHGKPVLSDHFDAPKVQRDLSRGSLMDSET